MQQHHHIGLVGYGLLYQAVVEQLEYPFVQLSLEELADTSCSLIIFIEDGWSPQIHDQLNRFCVQRHLPWLRAYCLFGKGIIGPGFVPGQNGCAMCAERRMLATKKEIASFTRIRERFFDGSFQIHHPGLTAFSSEILVKLIIEEINSYYQQSSRQQTRNALLSVQLDTLQCTPHRILPDPHCPVCGNLPLDTKEEAALSLQSRQKLAPYTYRVRDLSQEALLEKYVDPDTGMIHALVKDASNLYVNVNAACGLTDGLQIEQGFGRALDYETSQNAAIAEALERLAGLRPGGKKTAVRASYNQLGEEALDPTTLGLHTVEQYSLPKYPYIPYHHDLICNWVWGYSFQHKRPVLVPESCVYYGLSYRTKERPFLYEISNGCALGSCLEEAILHGLLEVVERDAFLMTWYAQLSIPRIDPYSTVDPTPGLLIERVEHMTGYTVHTFNATLEPDIPCFWVMAVDEQQRPDMPRALCAAGSHLHPEKALTNALHELAPILLHLIPRYQKERERALPMLTSPYEVKHMDDHTLLYALPEAFERLLFLYNTPRQHTFQEAFPAFYKRPPEIDLLTDLQACIARYLDRGLDVIVVNQTTSEQAIASLYCVKVLIPGMLPMTFGYAARRIANYERLYKLPYTLGYRSQPLQDAEINTHPHPFP